MYSFLLRKALPFALTFAFGAALGGLIGPFDGSGKRPEPAFFTRADEYGNHCRMRRHNLVAESKPLAILDKPLVFWAWDDAASPAPVRMLVTFGSDSTVQGVEQLDHFELPKVIAEEFKRAAWRIKFEPEKADGMSVTVRRVVEINYWVE